MWHRYFYSQINLQVIAIRLFLHKIITSSSIYILPNYKLKFWELTELIQKASGSIHDMENFNVHNPLWGSEKVRNKGNIEYALTNYNLCILNDGSNIYLHPGIGYYSSIDIKTQTISSVVRISEFHKHWLKAYYV